MRGEGSLSGIFSSGRYMRIFIVLSFLFIFAVGIFVSNIFFVNQKLSAYDGLSQSHTKCFELRPRSKYLECMRLTLEKTVKQNSALDLVLAGGKIDKIRNVSFDREINCHVMMHGVGRALSEYKKDFGEVVSSCQPLCGAGCYHGIMEGKYKVQQDIGSIMNSACEGLYQKGDLLANNCFHGLGHAIAIKNWDLDKSLRDCELVSINGQKECGAGVFMELFSRSEAQLMPLPVDVPSWCNSFERIYSQSCWIFAANVRGEKNSFLEAMGIDTSLPENEPIYNCSKSPEDFKKECFKMLGYTLYDAKNKDGKEIVKICEGLGGVNAEMCIAGVIERDLEEAKFQAGIGACNYIYGNKLREFCVGKYKNPVIN